MTCFVMKKFRPSPLIEKQVFISIIIVVAPDGAHGDAGAGNINVRDACFSGNILETAVAQVAIKSVLTSFTTIGDVEVRPGVTRGSLMHKVDATGAGYLFKVKTIPCER